MRKLPVSLAARALTVPAIIAATVQAPLPVRADISSPPSSSSSSLPTNWVQQYHQNGGGGVTGHVVGWGDQNYDIKADHFGVQSQDASVSGTATLGGSNTVSDPLGFQIGASHSYMTVATGDNSTTITNKLASLLNGGALTATVAGGGTGSGYTNNDIVTLLGVDSSCPTRPAFKLTVSGGNVTAAAIAGSGGSGIMGGYCQSTPTGGRSRSPAAPARGSRSTSPSRTRRSAKRSWRSPTPTALATPRAQTSRPASSSSTCPTA